MTDRVNVLCAKWGTKYGAEYINRLYAGVAKHLRRPFRFVCATNQSEGIRPEVECVPIDANPHVKNPGWPNIHAKLTVCVALRRAGNDCFAASAANRYFFILGMDSTFHCRTSL